MVLALITGGSGHVGSNLTRELIKQGYNVRCIDFDKDHRAFEGLDVEVAPPTKHFFPSVAEVANASSSPAA